MKEEEKKRKKKETENQKHKTEIPKTKKKTDITINEQKKTDQEMLRNRDYYMGQNRPMMMVAMAEETKEMT